VYFLELAQLEKNEHGRKTEPGSKRGKLTQRRTIEKI
jgi:hypothetical protein